MYLFKDRVYLYIYLLLSTFQISDFFSFEIGSFVSNLRSPFFLRLSADFDGNKDIAF